MSVTPHTDLGFDPEELRAKYRAERDRRIRPDGSAQYRGATGEFGHRDSSAVHRPSNRW